MRAPSIIALGLAALLPALSLAQFPSCAPDCKSCGLYCNEGCPAPLNQTECDRCLYCRRESSSCGYVPISWTEDPPDPAYCAQCSAQCHCYIDAMCYDGVTIPPPSSSSTVGPTPTPNAAVYL
ncbi:hypothetical protein F4777DRAFT_483780 [Nemania sp. FL0916]|nr:hypothetical protein F4777DRAFT_483780 [Nemania sp. FL0916]